MKIGFNLLLWTGTVTEEHFPLLADIKDWGADGVEVPIFDPKASPWDKLAREMDNAGLDRTVVSVLPKGANLIGEDKAERQAALDYLKACVDCTQRIGADVLAGPIYSPVGRLTGVPPTHAEREHCIEGLRALGQHAEGSGVTIAIEPLNRFETYFLNTMEQSAYILDKVKHPQVGVLYDTFHANIEEKNIYAAIQTGGKHIRHVHISANDRGTPGEDHVQYVETFAALRNIGYEGWLTIESFGSRLPELAAATCIWRPLAPSEEHVVREGVAFTRKSWNA
ncbi:MAG: sugar phosphate isomerase/epimerase [Candidatus Hydrogenedentes bacterium]|nr:sugar phosphate isomerase/epimerase [Candidatus Hydrogenedentota bacterium]MBI3118560.1 sugar phosphate isomerase/epimerase [Candidatus Hydrogenedentota bacterium]